MITKTYDHAKTEFGEIVGGKWPNETKFMVMLVLPSYVSDRLINTATGKLTSRIYVHKDLCKPLLAAFASLKDRDLLDELKTFDGCFMIRNVRGSSRPSTHSYGLAIDLNASENALGATPKLSPEFIHCFTEQGFVWGGAFKRLDGMHFQYAAW